jgi:rRNA maturation RNase YbeY
MPIEVLFEDVDVFDVNIESLSRSVEELCLDFGKMVGDLTLVFCSDEFILQTNNQFLQHNYYTDIITFDYCEGKMVSGDLLVSIDTVRSNSDLFSVEYCAELFRVVLHGVLHLCGLGDKTDLQVSEMRSAEEKYLVRFANPF